MYYQWTSSYSLRTELSFSAKYDRNLAVKPSKACVDHLSHGRMLIVLEPAEKASEMAFITRIQ